MECEEARERLLEYREGQLDLEGRMHLEAHLLVCEGCFEELQALEALLSAVAALPVPDPSPGFVRRVRARIREEKQGRLLGWLQGSRLRPAWAAAFLAFVLVAGGALWAVLPRAKPPPVLIGTLDARRQLPGPRDQWPVTSGQQLEDWRLATEEEAELILTLWPGRGRDWAALDQVDDRRLAALALGEDRPRSMHPGGVESELERGEERLSIEEVLQLWMTALPGRRAMEAFAGVLELPDPELEKLLDQMRG